jgi:hypothetical protein
MYINMPVDLAASFSLRVFSLSWVLSEQMHSLNPLKPELNPICYLLALLGAHHFLHVSRIRVKSLTIRLLMSYIYIYICGRSPAEIVGSNPTGGHGYLSVVSVVCCQLEVSTTS